MSINTATAREWVKSDDYPLLPDVKVKLTGTDGNAFAIMGAVMKAMRHAGVPKEWINEYQTEATSGDYDNLLRTSMKWVNVR